MEAVKGGITILGVIGVVVIGCLCLWLLFSPTCRNRGWPRNCSTPPLEVPVKGKRTILFTLVMAILGLAGSKISPDTVNAWLDVFIPIWAIGAILLRQITSSPVFQAEAAQLGLPHDLVSAITSISQQVRIDQPRLIAAVSSANAAASKLAGHPLADPAAMALLTGALIKLADPPDASPQLIPASDVGDAEIHPAVVSDCNVVSQPQPVSQETVNA